MNKTKIDWADMTWNPVTGCQHECPYCYARGIANRFGGHDCDMHGDYVPKELAIGPQRLSEPKYIMRCNSCMKAPYPWYFLPTFHEYRLDEPAKIKKPQTIFVCSMADLFGDWVPDEWIKTVFEACEAAPQHRYLFLTKNPDRYIQLADKGLLPSREESSMEMWFGTTTPTPDTHFFWSEDHYCFTSVEPIQEEFPTQWIPNNVDWLIVGAETGNRKDKIIPERRWIEELAFMCQEAQTPIFMKESLRDLMGDDFVQEFPWNRGDGK